MVDACKPLINHAALEAATVTVVTVCRNPGPLLAQAIDSVSSLGRPDVAHVVIDGASSDGTVDELRSRQGQLAFWCSEPDRGIYDAMNKGWSVASPNSYILFLGADDRLLSLPSAQELVEARTSGATLIYGAALIGDKPFISRFSADLRFGNTLHHQALLVSKSAHLAPPFNTKFRVYGDWDFNLRLWKRGERALFIPSLKSYAGPGGASAIQPLRETFVIVRDHVGLGASIIVCYHVLWNRLRGLFRQCSQRLCP
jgi:glycosyltransferase involved in cell wall biosynthesis